MNLIDLYSIIKDILNREASFSLLNDVAQDLGVDPISKIYVYSIGINVDFLEDYVNFDSKNQRYEIAFPNMVEVSFFDSMLEAEAFIKGCKSFIDSDITLYSYFSREALDNSIDELCKNRHLLL